ACDDQCVGPLLNDVDFLVESVQKNNISSFAPPPWSPLLRLDNQTILLQKAILKYMDVIAEASNISQNFIKADFETLADLMYLR
ncbi:Laminin subunit alpha-1, partial [Stegodyphus mimosarum]